MTVVSRVRLLGESDCQYLGDLLRIQRHCRLQQSHHRQLFRFAKPAD